MRAPTSVLITGGSSGIGEALAREYAADGMRLVLTGRDASRLTEVVEACRAQGADASCVQVDVTDRAAMDDLIRREMPIDLVIANAGISAGTGSGGSRQQADAEIFRVNLEGVLNTIYPAIDRLQEREPDADGVRGQIAIVSSMASFIAYRGAAAYGASKAAVRSLGEALRPELASQGIEMNVICPGFVRSRITAQNRFRMPFFMEADRAASLIRRKLSRNKPRIAFPWPMYIAARVVGGLPPGLSARIMGQRGK